MGMDAKKVTHAECLKKRHFLFNLIPPWITRETSTLEGNNLFPPNVSNNIIKSLNTYGAFLLRQENLRRETSGNEWTKWA